MTSKSFNQKSVGTSFETKSGVTDLSDLAKGSLIADSSMSGGNMVTDKAGPLQLGAPGTASEQTATNLLGEALAQNNVTDPASAPQGHNPKEVH